MEEYILSHIDPEGEYLSKLYRETHLQLLYPHMVSGHLQGRILKMLTRTGNWYLQRIFCFVYGRRLAQRRKDIYH